MNIVERNQDVIYGLDDLEQLYQFANFPVFMGCTDKPREEDIHANMCWSISKGSGMIQLNPMLQLDILYPEAHGSGCVGGLWLEHHQEFASFLRKHTPKAILEIGGAHGILNREYQKENPIDWTILEPNPTPVDGVDAHFIKGFFDDKFSFDRKVDTIVHSHVFEHVYYPDEFMSHISGFLTDGQKLIFSLPNMDEMLKRKYTNCINFEHTIFITEPYVEHLLSRYGFRMVEKKYFRDDHSIFYAYVKDTDVPVTKLSDNLYDDNKKLYSDYISYHEELIRDLNEKIAKLDDGRPVYLFGAHVFAQYLIGFGLNTDRIVCLLDNDNNKHQKRLYGTNLTVQSPKILKDINSPIVILKAGVYNNEIRDDILQNINSSVTFV